MSYIPEEKDDNYIYCSRVPFMRDQMLPHSITNTTYNAMYVCTYLCKYAHVCMYVCIDSSARRPNQTRYNDETTSLN